MKSALIALLALCLCLMGCGQGPAVVTKADANSYGTVAQAKSKEFAEIKAKAESGDADAQNMLGVIYSCSATSTDDGKTWKEWGFHDYKEAVKWLRKAAEEGHAPVQINLGGMYAYGPGTQSPNQRPPCCRHLAGRPKPPRQVDA